MTYAYFALLAKTKGWTVPVLRCEAAGPPAELSDVMDALGLAKYERFVTRFERENR